MSNPIKKICSSFSRFILTILCTLSLLKVNAQMEYFEWAVNGGYSYSAYIATDNTGNLFATGMFLDSATFGSTVAGTEMTLMAASLGNSVNTDSYLAKYSTDGELLWINQIGGDGLALSQAVTTDSAGNVYITGHYTEEIDFGSQDLNNQFFTTPGQAMFVAKYDNNGFLLWVIQTEVDETSQVYGNGIDIDPAGNPYVTGEFTGTSSFGLMGSGTVSTATAPFDVYVVKYDAAGAFLWVETAGGDSDVFSKSISVDAAGNAYITGSYFDATFDATMLSALGARDIFVAKYDATGAFQWAESAGGATSDDEGHGIVVDAAGNVYLTGYFYGSADFGGMMVTATGSIPLNAFVAHYDTDGNVVWVQTVGSTTDGNSVGNGIVLGADGGPIATGYYLGDAVFGDMSDSTIMSDGSFFAAAFVVKYDPDGLFVWAKSAPSSSNITGLSLAVDSMENVFMSGYFNNDATFDDSMLASFAGEFSDNFFITKITPFDRFAIPTLGEWGLIILSLMVVIGGWVAIRQRKVQSSKA